MAKSLRTNAVLVTKVHYISVLNVTMTLDSGFEPKPRLMFSFSNSEERFLQVKVFRGDTTCTIPKREDTAYVQVSNELLRPKTYFW